MTKASRVVQGIFAAVFGLTFIAVFLRGAVKLHPLVPVLALAASLLLSFGLIKLYGFINVKTKKMNRRQINKVFFCISAAVLIFQIFYAITLKYPPISDLGYVDGAARAFSENWDKSVLYNHLDELHQNYFARYTNNQALLIILSLIYSACRRIFGTMPLIVPVLVNTAGLHISYILMYLISGKIFRDKCTPLFCAAVGAGFCVFYSYTSYFYTDSMSMPFAMGSIYFFLCGRESKNLKKKIPLILLSAFLLIAGFKIKGNIIILIPVFLLYLAVTLRKTNIKSHLQTACILVAGLILSSAVCSAFIGSFNIADEDELRENRFPPQHWIMMGLHDRGGYNDEDFLFTYNAGDYEQKKTADTLEIKRRISNYGITGMVKHIAKKVAYTWNDGGYFMWYYLQNSGTTNPIKRFVSKNLIYLFYCTFYQYMLMLMIVYSFVKGASKNRQGEEIFLKIVFCAVYFFFIIWETRSRYLTNFSPVYIILAVYSIKTIFNTIKLKSLKK